MARIAILAYEVSADQLGQGLLEALKQRLPDLECEGIVGERLQAGGCNSLMPASHLAVMGLVEVLAHLPRLLLTRYRLVQHFSRSRPAVFIGIDAPDFNLGLEQRLRRAGIPTVHYVSPTFWAWRQGRVAKLRQAADLVLCIFPFESEVLCQQGVNALYVGHPLAQRIPLEIDQLAARRRLGLPQDAELVAILPGSRRSEIKRLAKPFLDAALLLAKSRPGIRFVLPTPNAQLRAVLEAELGALGEQLECLIVQADSHSALAAADVVLTASGTATMETLLHKRPMVVGYRLNALSYALMRRLLQVPHVAMANLLAGEALAPEFLQRDCTPEALAQALAVFLDNPGHCRTIAQRYARIHQELRKDSAALAADAIVALMDKVGPDRTHSQSTSSE
jgi:lipid-A-disaccharide synthase